MFSEDKKYSYEDALSLFISNVAREVDPKNRKDTFEKIVKLFHLNKPTVYGDFVIDTSKIIYI